MRLTKHWRQRDSHYLSKTIVSSVTVESAGMKVFNGGGLAKSKEPNSTLTNAAKQKTNASNSLTDGKVSDYLENSRLRQCCLDDKSRRTNGTLNYPPYQLGGTYTCTFVRPSSLPAPHEYLTSISKLAMKYTPSYL